MHSVTSWFAEEDDSYLVVVSSKEAEGDFVLTIHEGEANDACSTSMGPLKAGMEIYMNGTGLLPARSENLPLPSCGSVESGSWFSVQGTGKGVRAHICQGDEDTQARVRVLEGHSQCSDLTCKVDTRDTPGVNICNPGERSTTVSWRSDSSKVYYVQVDPADDSVSASGRPSYRLLLEEFSTTHDSCNDAVRLVPPGIDKISGTTGNATRTGNRPSCAGDGDESADTAGVWYQLVGSGTAIRTSVCDNSNPSPVSLEVFEKSCESLGCVDAMHVLGRSPCKVEWISETGAMYYLFVSSEGANNVDFQLSVSDYQQIAPNDLCEDAIELVPNESNLVFGSTASARRNDAVFAGEDADGSLGDVVTCTLYAYGFHLPWAPAVWYYVVGTGKEMGITTCHEGTTADTRIIVSRGRCSSLFCIASDDPSILCDASPASSTLTFDTVKDEVYHIMVTGPFLDDNNILGPPVGDFVLAIQETGGIANDHCRNAQHIVPKENEVYKGTTVNAATDEEVDCAPLCTGGVWYTTRGTGAVLRATLLFLETAFSGAITIYAGPCEKLNEVGERVRRKTLLARDTGGALVAEAGGSYEWRSDPGVIYFIHVWGIYDQGRFGLELEELKEVAPLPVNQCDSATIVNLNSKTTFGSGANASRHVWPRDCPENAEVGVWYRLEGSSEEAIFATTCSPITETSAAIRIYAGDDCSDLCEAVNGIGLACPNGDLGSMVAWNGDVATQYYIHVQAGPTDGRFSLDTFSSPGIAPENDSCGKATELLIGGEVVTGSTLLGDIDMRRRPICRPVGPFSVG